MMTATVETTYHVATPARVREVLEMARANGNRLRLSYGDAATGEDWLEEHDVTGTIGRSVGPKRVPLLIPTRRSSGGTAILDHCIVRIRSTDGTVVYYEHPTYHIRGSWVSVPDSAGGYVLRRDGAVHARFKSGEALRRYLRAMGFERAPIVNPLELNGPHQGSFDLMGPEVEFYRVFENGEERAGVTIRKDLGHMWRSWEYTPYGYKMGLACRTPKEALKEFEKEVMS